MNFYRNGPNKFYALLIVSEILRGIDTWDFIKEIWSKWHLKISSIKLRNIDLGFFK